MNLKAHHPGFKIWAGAQADIDRIVADLARVPRRRWRTVSVRQPATHGGCHVRAGGHAASSTYDVKLDSDCAA